MGSCAVAMVPLSRSNPVPGGLLRAAGGRWGRLLVSCPVTSSPSSGCGPPAVSHFHMSRPPRWPPRRGHPTLFGSEVFPLRCVKYHCLVSSQDKFVVQCGINHPVNSTTGMKLLIPSLIEMTNKIYIKTALNIHSLNLNPLRPGSHLQTRPARTQ